MNKESTSTKRHQLHRVRGHFAAVCLVIEAFTNRP